MKKNQNKSFNLKLIILAATVAIIGFWGLKLFKPAQIALVGQDGRVTCNSNVATFRFSNSCGNGMVNRVDYECNYDSKKGYEGGGPSDCIDPIMALAHAQTFCGQTCIGDPATPPYPPQRPPTPPKPKPPVPPRPTDSSRRVSCVIESYAIPKNMRTSSINSGMLAPYIFDPKVTSVKVGDRLVFGIRLTNINPYPITSGDLNLEAWTGVLNAPVEPFTIVSQSPICTKQGDSKTISCRKAEFKMNVGESKAPNIYFVAQVTKPTNDSNIDVLYEGKYSQSPFSCPPVSVNVESRSNIVCKTICRSNRSWMPSKSYCQNNCQTL